MKIIRNTVAFFFLSFFLGLAPLVAADTTSDNWIDISSANLSKLGGQGGIGGCAGCAVNRLNGDVMVNFIGFGLWKSSDRGQSWARLDGGAIGGRGESGWAVQVDQDNPKRVAVFSLDGNAGYTTDGTNWIKFKGMGRNWDFGSVDWGSQDAKVILAGKHESGGEVDGSNDDGQSWTRLSINMDPQRNRNACMIGVLDAHTFIYSNNNGIHRSTDQGATWTQVSDFQPRSKIPVLFKKKFYLCTSQGLIVSKDKGATWQRQGSEMISPRDPISAPTKRRWSRPVRKGFSRPSIPARHGHRWPACAAASTGKLPTTSVGSATTPGTRSTTSSMPRE
jgi:hypothetical protein